MTVRKYDFITLFFSILVIFLGGLTISKNYFSYKNTLNLIAPILSIIIILIAYNCRIYRLWQDIYTYKSFKKSIHTWIPKFIIIYFCIRIFFLFYLQYGNREEITDYSILSIINIIIIIPIVEEIFFRGILFRGIKQKTNLVLAMIISSIIFAIFHENNAGAAFISGIICCYIYEKGDLLMWSIILHIINNGMAIL